MLFKGFEPDSFQFLAELEENNNRQWFDNNRSRYENNILTPLRHLVEDLAECMITIDDSIEVSPAVNKTISRIFRDIRFSRDKRPFRSNMWITFKSGNSRISQCAGFYMEINPEGYQYGCGFYSATSDQMKNIRRKIRNNPDCFKNIIKAIDRDGRFELCGNEYKRPPSGEIIPGLENWFRYKSFYYRRLGEIDGLITSEKFSETLITDYLIFASLYRFIMNIK